jgi:hypothetical protein
MPKSADFDEVRIAKAIAAAISQKKPNIAKIAREIDVNYGTLTSRVKKGQIACYPKGIAEVYPSRILGESLDQMDRKNAGLEPSSYSSDHTIVGKSRARPIGSAGSSD